MTTLRRLGPWIALAFVVGVAVGVVVARSGSSDSPEARASRLARQLACPVCTGESVAESNAPEARAMRDDFRERIERGESDAQIRQAYVDVYGEQIVLNPSDDGLGLIAWGLPVVAVVLAGAGLAFALRRWSREPRLAATADDEVLVARERKAET